MSRYGTTRSSYGRDVHPGALIPNRAEVETERLYVLDGNGADEEPEQHGSEDGWITLN
ncbi:hypothetical protein [Streptomyces thermodiastaticus]|uniref:hypothetical protein n=1 Tax=Streptomyces thermodiastaticus TaxID=44061 RepID=UPI00167AA922|nr:hypothetical protein [Streptomyces thermodiastaticus]MCE7552769.1 hypothetical protein [Streptomyces thermodiastaticus]GHF89043.1 hypothetical protein GCM10018787_42160 [Streptomyces thermodiastaticus]